MKLRRKVISGLCFAVIGLLVSGCADPLTKYLCRYGYVAAIPAPETLYIGDVYDTTYLRDPYALMKDLFPAEENGEMMASLNKVIIGFVFPLY